MSSAHKGSDTCGQRDQALVVSEITSLVDFSIPFKIVLYQTQVACDYHLLAMLGKLL